MTETQEGGKVEDSSTDGTNIEAQAHDLLEKFKGLFANYYPSESDISKSYSLFEKMDPERAFDVIAAELGFMYDQLYTKEKVIYTRWGLACRFITFSLTCSVLIIFCLGHDKDKYRKVDLTITLLLLVFAVLLEIYAALVLLFSDQTKLWFMRREISYVLKPINFLQPLFKIPSWSGLMGQCSLISICVKQKRRLGLYSYVTYSKVPPNLTSLIHRNVVSDSSPKEADSFEYRLEIIFKRYDIDPFPPNYCWSEFDLTILTWHIATEICFYEDEDGLKKDINPETKSSVDLSQGMSRYLMYLLVSYPLMLPIGATAVNFRDLVAHTRRLISKGWTWR
ncbi:hypothetical protein COLO4_13582 [Corchorus olitorius]|uniref:DUF4220 domain-containing protein n=1 Tax=Corchorus olitorius TaxID=93759 RepID=A0A1R3JVR4_9ROSI|nr:hypothetical protein COLO4_13582 [Corchorus olitorius]